MASFLRKRKKCLRRMFLSHSKGVIRFMCKYIRFKVLIFLYLETLRGKERERRRKKKVRKIDISQKSNQ